MSHTEQELPIPDRVPQALSLRTDAIGIFAVLAIAGLAQLITTQPDSIRDQLTPPLADLWSATLLIFGVLGLVGTFLSRTRQIVGMGLEMASRIALGAGALTYAVAVYMSIGFPSGRFVVLTYTGIAIMMLAGAYQISRWLRLQRKAVDRALEGDES